MIYFRKKRKAVKIKFVNSRLHVVLAIIFLLVGALFYQLINLQINKHEFYAAIAADQHLAVNKLKAERGRIFIQDIVDQESKLYPIATNKDFALVYAVPRKIKNPQDTAEKLFTIFDKEDMQNQISENLENDTFFNPETELSGPELEERNKLKEAKRELEEKTKKEEIINKYLAKLEKKNDPYEPLQAKVDKEKLKEVMDMNIEGIDYIMKRHRYYPEKDMGAHLVGFVGYEDKGLAGRYGLEGFFNDELSGKPGTLKSERSATGDLIIINDREYQKPQNGSNLILTINRSIQYTVCKRLVEVAMRHGADGGTVIVMEPNTGAILAMCSWPSYDPNFYSEEEDINIFNNPAIFDSYEPGSVFKSITMAAAVDQGKVKPDTVFFDKGYVNIEGWDKPLRNSDYETHGGHGSVDMTIVLEKSLNTGIIFAMQKIGAEKFAEYVKNFGFGEKTGIELETEGLGDIRNLYRKTIRPVEAATAAFGQGITVTPLQMITAYAVIANGGILVKPYLVNEIISADGNSSKTQPQKIRRVISERTALLVSGMLVNVVDSGHAVKAGVKGYYVAGKTGTAQVADKGGYSDKTIHTFVGFAPVDEPKFVMLVKLDDPKDVRYAASSAAPLFGELAAFILDYYQVPKER